MLRKSTPEAPDGGSNNNFPEEGGGGSNDDFPEQDGAPTARETPIEEAYLFQEEGGHSLEEDANLAAALRLQAEEDANLAAALRFQEEEDVKKAAKLQRSEDLQLAAALQREADPMRAAIYRPAIVVADGYHKVPEGVAVEELRNFNGAKSLKRDCPKAVSQLMARKGLKDVYTKFVESIYDQKNTRGPLGEWRDVEFNIQLDKFRGDFAAKGVKVALCRRRLGSSTGGTYRWIEFIDVARIPSYVPIYDVGNLSGQVIRTAFVTLDFPKGVAVKQLMTWENRQNIMTSIPTNLKQMLQERGLMDAYTQMAGDLARWGGGNNFYNRQAGNRWGHSFQTEKVKALVRMHQEVFRGRQVDIYFNRKKERVRNGRQGAIEHWFRWIEFVDRTKQPLYVPRQYADHTGHPPCLIM